MNFSVDHAQGKVPVTILAPEGDVDGSNYQALIAKAQELHAGGMQYLLLDLQHVAYMSSAGIIALHSISKLLKGETPPDVEGGWEAIHAVEREQTTSKQTQLKLLSPQPRVDRVLDMAGLTQVFEIYRDRDTAVASF